MLDRPKDAGGEKAPEYSQLKQGRKRAALLGVAWAGVTSLVPALVSGFVFAIASRYLTPGEFGLVALAASIAALAAAIAPSGFGFALVQRSDIRKEHIDSVFWMCMAFGAVLYVVLFFAAPVFADVFREPELSLLLRVLSLRVLFDLASVVPQALLARELRFDRLALRTTVATLSSAVVCLVLLATGYGLWALALSQLAAASASTIAALFSVSWRPALSFELPALRQLARYGIFASGQKILQTINLDQILLGALLGTTALGLYGFARRIFQLFNDLFGGTLNSVSYPLLSSLQNEPEKLREAFQLAVFASSIISFPVFVGTAVVANDLVPVVFGSQWLEAVPALRGFCLIGILSCIGVLQASLITGRGHMDWWMYYQLIQQLTTAALIVLLYPLGITVLVFAIAVKAWIAFPFPVAKTRRILGISMGALLRPLATPAFACAIMAAAIFTLRPFVADSPPIVRLGAEISTGAIVYSAVVIALAGRRLLEFRSFLTRRRRAT